MMAKDLRSENDNLKEWRNKKKSLTEQLLARAIQELQSLNAKINQKNVCEMMEKLSTSKDKEYDAVITPSAISKNEIYKNMILEANEKSKFNNIKNEKYKIDGDKQFEIFKLKTIIAKQEAKNKELEAIIQRANIQNNSFLQIQKANNIDFQSILKDLVNFTRQEGIAFLDKDMNLITESEHQVLISSQIIKLLNLGNS
ncbi:hypothetical protein [Aliarcobacter cryaerophilus]|uniref:hypothetical protein n=1 Tax=Aliarcobacter cryaerophilus TaxID=28198 RepID=UPI0021B69ABF|nr:hypothetical protein [Aliarcobacter cryaerophilus]MCT7406608.1 hypothetical protein [Aliarcobacter cryaerophilus]MCT7504312.1 hypothetical protein [Aliarcobacter cryaerophilus]